ncbi:MAG TPA: S53 family peptidase [Ktedonobacteraceae bacterium]
MAHSTRMSILLLIVFLLLTSCTLKPNGIATNHNPTPLASSPPPLATITANTCPAQMLSCLTPHAMRVAYGIDPLIQKGFTGKGQTIVDIVSFGSPTLQQDMKVFDQTFNLPPVDVQAISPLNIPEYDPHHDKDGWAQETELDVQIIHALAPEAKIIVLQSPVAETEGTVGLPEYRKLEQYVIDHQLGYIVSQSWGASELTLQDGQGQQEIQQWNDFLQQGVTNHHITYLSASGDTGATDYVDDHNDLGNIATTSFAADSPWVTGVGGTSLSTADSTSSETAWSDGGGGFSRFYQTPSYQKLLPTQVLQQFNNQRGVPDVSAEADPNTGLPVYLQGQWSSAGGTSASTPVWAAVAAIANQMAGHPLGFINPGLYKLANSGTYQQDFHDITEGNNSNLQADVKGYSAAPGWDPVTGLGTPNAQNLIPDLIAALK